MAKLTTKARKALPRGDFAGPGSSYPVPDASHAKNAKARASQAVGEGRMPKGEESHIDAKANRVLGDKPSRDLPQRGERTEKNREASHPQSHAEFEKLGR